MQPGNDMQQFGGGGGVTDAQLAQLRASPAFWLHCREHGLSPADLQQLEQRLAAYRVGLTLEFLLSLGGSLSQCVQHPHQHRL